VKSHDDSFYVLNNAESPIQKWKCKDTMLMMVEEINLDAPIELLRPFQSGLLLYTGTQVIVDRLEEIK
jgi:hypothetical protein